MMAIRSWIVSTGLGALCLACESSATRESAPQPKVDAVLSEASKQPLAVSSGPPPTESAAPAAQPNVSTAFADGRAALKARKFAVAAAAFDIACEQEGQLQACVALAELLDSGRGVREDPDRAKALLLRACAADLQSACDQLGH